MFFNRSTNSMPLKSICIALVMAVNLTACANIMAKVLPSNHQTLDAEKFPGGTYKMDMSHTNLSFSISHMGFSNYIGRFNKLEGMLIFDPAKADTPNISLTVDINSIDTNHRGLEEQLRGKGFFNAEKYPTATFIGTSLNITDPANGILIGEFTLMGVTKTVQFDIHFKGGAKHPMGGHFVLGFEATTTIKRSEFSFKALIPMIGDDVKLTFNGEFHRTGD